MSGALNCARPDVWLAAAAGLVMGFKHAADPDHVVAVSTLVARGRRFSAAWRVGAAWGLGHTATLTAAGSAVLVLQCRVPPALTQGLERAVGAMLVLLGVGALAGLGGRPREHRHTHVHGERQGPHGHHLHAHGEHSHPHVHVPELEALTRGERPRLARSFLVGMVHGLAGSSAISLALLAAMPSVAAGAAYLLVFGFGTLAGMTLVSAVFALSLARLGAVASLDRWLAPSVGAASVALGLAKAWGGLP